MTVETHEHLDDKAAHGLDDLVALDASHREELRSLIDSYGDDLPLDRALLLIAKEEYPDVDMGRYLSFLDRLADRAVHHASDTGDLTRALTHAIFQEGGFRGNRENYYDPKNSLLNAVIDRRLGIPITLSIIFMEVARRAGSHAVGIGFPGHFLVRHECDGRAVMLDPFEKGTIVRRADCERLLKSQSGTQTELEPWMLEPASPRAIVLRVLTNLKHAYMLQKDLINAVKAIDRLLIVDHGRWTDRRDRGLLFKELNCAGAAIADLESYAEHATDKKDLDLIRRVLPELRKQRSQLN
jgi:regulator of sirC expression with transglutaminase-like and TPR domain